MKKWIDRLLYLNLLIGYIFVKPFQMSGFIDEMTLQERLTGLWVVFSILSLLYLWGYMFYHWKKGEFKTPVIKKVWLLVLIIGGVLQFYGPMIYYPVVIEFKKTLRGQ